MTTLFSPSPRYHRITQLCLTAECRPCASSLDPPLPSRASLGQRKRRGGLARRVGDLIKSDREMTGPTTTKTIRLTSRSSHLNPPTEILLLKPQQQQQQQPVLEREIKRRHGHATALHHIK